MTGLVPLSVAWITTSDRLLAAGLMASQLPSLRRVIEAGRSRQLSAFTYCRGRWYVEAGRESDFARSVCRHFGIEAPQISDAA